ncbi:MAG: cobalamin-dependent protein [Desulfobacteraceae bacterium]|nr:cobalamin-dependent protein [Desulfobacteraceae bacterium]
MKAAPPIHPKGLKAKVLLASVFGPFAQDDAYGSRAINPMELYQNQVTRAQGAFSLRMFHRSFNLLMLQANIDAPCTVLDFPDRERFVHELETNPYDIIGITAILPNLLKVQTMCTLIRRHQPRATIVVGGHIAAKPDLAHRIDADHIVRGEGIAWLRSFLGQPTDAPVRHPAVYSAFGTRILGITLPDKPGDTAAILIPSVGCPVGCNFCSTSALFGGKGHSVNFFDTGDALFEVMEGLEAKLKVRSFFVLDENFLIHRKRALRLLELMRANDKSWSLDVFSSARVLCSYDIQDLVDLGIGWVWMGIEGDHSGYRKLEHVDTRALVKTLQSHGIRVLGSSIIGLDHHRPENIPAVIDAAVAHATDFHQFMLYTAIPGTPLHAQRRQNGTLLPETELAPADAHGQYRFNYRHPHIRNGAEADYLVEAFTRDFTVNGPSLARLIRTHLTGWQRYRNWPDPRVRRRYAREAAPLRTTHAGAVWAMRRYYRHDPLRFAQMDRLLKDLGVAFGAKTRLAAPVIGRWTYGRLKKEEARLAAGWHYEPACFYEKNAAAQALEKAEIRQIQNAPARGISVAVPLAKS